MTGNLMDMGTSMMGAGQEGPYDPKTGKLIE